MKIKTKLVGRIEIPADKCVFLDHVKLRDEDYSNRKLVQFGTFGSHLEACHFNGIRLDNNAYIQLGSGQEASEFVECSFDGARLHGGGGFSRFVRCSFKNVDLRNWTCLRTEFIGCIFSGNLRKCAFNGTVPEADRAWVGRDRNEFYDNDFSAADLIEVDFRTGIDLTQQHLPSGVKYLYLINPLPAIEAARANVLGWTNFEHRRIALIMLKTMEEEVAQGQRQLFLRESDHYGSSAFPREAVKNVFALLRGGAENMKRCTGLGAP